MRLVQFCNVGNVVGGTAACAWTVTRALPEVEHTVIFRSSPAAQTRAAFSHCQVEIARTIDEASLKKWGGDFLMLHNIAAANVYWGADIPILQMPVIQYIHSAMRGHASANRVVACSRYLAEQLKGKEIQVVYQGVVCPSDSAGNFGNRIPSKQLIIGRICTPVSKKWPGRLIRFYQKLAKKFPQARWEFVGCPAELQSDLQRACLHRAAFFEASWEAREHLNRWHVLLYSNPEVTETFGRTVCEAMRAGCVPVVDCAGGFCEQIGKQDGFLCKSEGDFLIALEQLSCLETWKQFSTQGKISADAMFSLASFRERLLELFVGVRH